MALVRDAGKVYGALHDLPGKPVLAKEKLRIIFPVRFAEIKLAVIGEESYVYGLFAIAVGDRYAVCNLNAYVELGRASISKAVYNGEEYYEYNYEPGDIVIRTKEIMARSNLIFTSIDEFIFKGKLPWYVDYEDVGKLYETAEKFSGTKAKINPSVMEFLAAYIARKKDDRTKFIREGATSKKDFTLDKLSWVPLRSVFWSAPGTVNKIAGAYYADGVVSALVTKNQKVETVEGILRA